MKWIAQVALCCLVIVGCVTAGAMYGPESARSRLLEDQITDMQNVQTHAAQLAAAHDAGRLEGLLIMASPDAKTSHWTSQVWHNGFDQGMSVGQDLAKAEYEKGYHAALKDAGCPDGSKSHVYIPPQKTFASTQ